MVDRRREGAIKHLAFGVSLAHVPGVAALYQCFQLDVPRDAVRRSSGAWIPGFGIQYHVGVDGISLLLVLLTTFLTALAILSSYAAITTR